MRISAKQGKMADDAGFNASFPSTHDPYQAPPGKCSGLISQMAVYDLKDGGHNKWLNREFREEYMLKQIAKLQQYAPNITRDNVLWTYITTPADIQNKFANMVRGGLQAGRLPSSPDGISPAQPRVFAVQDPGEEPLSGRGECLSRRMRDLGPGYNCANTVAEDCGIEKWWKEPEIVTDARERGYI